MKRPRLARRRGVLAVIAGLLLTSALIRIVTGADAAVALIGNAQANSAPAEAAATCPDQAELSALLAAIQARETRISQRENQLQDRMHALTVAEEEITRQMAALVEAEEQLRATVASVETAAVDDIDRLISVYQLMKPKEAAALFETMAPEFAAGFLGRMAPDAAAGILAGMTPQAAYTVSVILAGRNAAAPRD